MSTFVLMYFFVLLYFCNLFGLSIRTSMQNLESVALYFCTFFVRKWQWAVKIYFHAKFRASSSKIERVMVNFVLPARAPVTNLPVELCASRQLIIATEPLNKSNYTRKKLKTIRRFSQYCSSIGG